MLAYGLPRNYKLLNSPAENALRILVKSELLEPAVYLFSLEKGRKGIEQHPPVPIRASSKDRARHKLKQERL